MLLKTKVAGLMMAVAVLAAPMVHADSGVAPVAAPAVPPIVSHQDGDWQQGGWEHGKEHHILAKVLGLSDDQVKQLKGIHQKQKDAMKSLFAQVKSNREALDSEIIKTAPDMGKINDIETQFKTLQSQMVDNHLNSTLEIKKIMTPEQFAGFMALKKERKLMHDGHHKSGHRDGFGKSGNGHRPWGDQGDKGHASEDQD